MVLNIIVLRVLVFSCMHCADHLFNLILLTTPIHQEYPLFTVPSKMRITAPLWLTVFAYSIYRSKLIDFSLLYHLSRIYFYFSLISLLRETPLGKLLAALSIVAIVAVQLFYDKRQDSSINYDRKPTSRVRSIKKPRSPPRSKPVSSFVDIFQGV